MITYYYTDLRCIIIKLIHTCTVNELNTEWLYLSYNNNTNQSWRVYICNASCMQKHAQYCSSKRITDNSYAVIINANMPLCNWWPDCPTGNASFRRCPLAS